MPPSWPPAPADERAGLHAPPGAGRGRLVRALSATPGLPSSSPCPPVHALTCWAWCEFLSEADALAIKEIEKTTNHDVKAVEYWIKSKFEARPELLKATRVRALRLHQRRHQQHQPRAAAARRPRRGAAAGAGPASCSSCARWRGACRRAHAQPHPRPDRQPHHRGQGDRQRRRAPAGRLRPDRRRQDPGQDERRRGQLQRPPVGLARLRLGGLQPPRRREARSRRPPWAWA
jgi:hypothetical protein